MFMTSAAGVFRLKCFRAVSALLVGGIAFSPSVYRSTESASDKVHWSTDSDGFGESLFGLSSVAQDVRVRAVGDGGRRRVVRGPGRADRERGREEPEHLGNI